MLLDDEVKDLKPQQTVASKLRATVTFDVGFILPGGYWAQEGPIPSTPILRKKNAAFQAFVIANAMAMVLSLSAIFIHFLISTKTLRQMTFLVNVAHCFIPASMLAMTVAFVRGTPPMLAPSLRLSVANCVLGLRFILFVLFAMFEFAYGLAQRLLGFMI